MAKIEPPSKKTQTKPSQVQPTDQIPPGQLTRIQIVNCSKDLKADFKAYLAKCPHNAMHELFEAMFEEYKKNHPI